jgi:carboxylate-amine ligase
MHQAVVEVGTNICYNIQQARDEVIYLRKHIIELADAQNLKVAAAGTHPFADWQDQLITDNPRYDALIDEMRDVARGNLIFGLHVHVGIENRNQGLKYLMRFVTSCHIFMRCLPILLFGVGEIRVQVLSFKGF